MAVNRPVHLALYGLLGDLDFTKARCCAESMKHREPEKISEVVVVPMLEFDWDMFVEEKKKELRGDAWTFEDKAIAFINGEFLGGATALLDWAMENYNYEDFRPVPLYQTFAEQQYVDFLNSRKHDFVFMDISIGGEPAGRLVIELFSNDVPKTCENFKCLCTGERGVSEHNELESYNLHYKGHLFHRIVPNGWIQGGDIWADRGNGGECVFDEVFEDENFAIKHDRRGIIGMANKGRHTNGSQFYITLQAAPWMNTKYVAFGQVIKGTETLKKIESQETIIERPSKDIRIADCGPLTFSY
ncbi:uncharacterized protein LOC135487413 [Lineus longissimus]|uniref:uncharacterized protein LOC135487413 n=1 Tax=Lineus longissimus TaxID=88925 RepID=UPI002B4F3135